MAPPRCTLAAASKLLPAISKYQRASSSSTGPRSPQTRFVVSKAADFWCFKGCIYACIYIRLHIQSYTNIRLRIHTPACAIIYKYLLHQELPYGSPTLRVVCPTLRMGCPTTSGMLTVTRLTRTRKFHPEGGEAPDPIQKVSREAPDPYQKSFTPREVKRLTPINHFMS